MNSHCSVNTDDQSWSMKGVTLVSGRDFMYTYTYIYIYLYKKD